jgi:ABC-type nitrate/sulfonate/bicarbonate transport system substrate-binding protein
MMVLKFALALLAAALPMMAAAQTKITLGYTQANAFMAAFVAKDQGFFA